MKRPALKTIRPILLAFLATFTLVTQARAVGYWGRDYDPNLQRWIQRDPIGERGGINLYDFVSNNPVNFVDPMGLYIWQTQYWADLSVQGSWWQQAPAWPLGVISAAVPDTGGIFGGGTAGSGVVGSVGAANMSFWSKDPNDPCHGHNATYTTVGRGLGNTQAGVNAGLALGWGDFESPTASTFTGDFNEFNLSIGDYSVTFWSGNVSPGRNWLGITIGLTTPSASGNYQYVNYQFAH
jgi:RHS repeat-associated protein